MVKFIWFLAAAFQAIAASLFAILAFELAEPLAAIPTIVLLMGYSALFDKATEL